MDPREGGGCRPTRRASRLCRHPATKPRPPRSAWSTPHAQNLLFALAIIAGSRVACSLAHRLRTYGPSHHDHWRDAVDPPVGCDGRPEGSHDAENGARNAATTVCDLSRGAAMLTGREESTQPVGRPRAASPLERFGLVGSSG